LSSGALKAVPRMSKQLAVAALVSLAGVLAAPGAAAAGTDPSWAIQSTPNPPHGDDTNLVGVSCPSAKTCIAAGFSESKSGVELPLAEYWNGKRWVIKSTPNPSDIQGGEFAGVSCSSDTACTAAGDSQRRSGADVALAERWNGKKWAIQSTPNPSGAKDTDPLAVSCSSSTACATVGEYQKSSGVVVTLALQWSRKKWAIKSTPNPSGADGSVLQGASCSSGNACTAVGYYQNSSGVDVTLALHWNGSKWAIQSTPNRSHADGSELFGVSRVSGTAITAIGYYDNVSGDEFSLAERRS
jgi:hypothetical protein